ncbi:MAG TPA: ribosome-associated translation inhibitor RaiA, partial [Clostridiales bacterium]|nr:ribosome-associated translation inhibitor RaiA [Clostridiales bacterium]
MKAEFVLRKFTLTDDIKEKIEKKLSHFDRFFPDDTQVVITLFKEGIDEVVELTIYDKGTFYRAEQYSSDVLTSMDLAVEVIDGQIRKYKTKLEKRLREGAFADYADDVEEEETDFKIIKTKRFLYKPESLEEAILQMNLLGHQ